MLVYYCDICGSKASEATCAVVRLTYTLRMSSNRSRNFGGSRGSIELCEGCKQMAIDNKIGEIIASSIVDKLKQIQGMKNEN